MYHVIHYYILKILIIVFQNVKIIIKLFNNYWI